MLGCCSADRCPSVRGEEGPAEVRLAVVWLGVEAGVGEDAAMLVPCVQNMSGIFWLMRKD